MRTNVPHIYACGDVNGVFPFTHVAGYEAGIALSNAVLRLPRKADYTKVPWCTYTDPEVASIGLNEKRAKQAGVEYRVLAAPFREVDRALAAGEPGGMIKVLVRPSGALLGCQIAGHNAGELIHEWVAAINGGVKLSTMAGAIHAYPTLAEISKKAAGSYYSEKLFGDRTKKVLRFLFGLRGECVLAGKEAGMNARKIADPRRLRRGRGGVLLPRPGQVPDAGKPQGEPRRFSRRCATAHAFLFPALFTLIYILQTAFSLPGRRHPVPLPPARSSGSSRERSSPYRAPPSGRSWRSWSAARCCATGC